MTAVFHKPWSIPLAVKDSVDRIKTGTNSEKVTHSNRAVSIFVVPKGTFRLCGDYKVTVKSLEIDQYPLLRPDEALSKGVKFSKIDLLLMHINR